MLFLIPHLFPPPRLRELAAPGLHLPALQTLLARGQRVACPAEGTEAALCSALGIERQHDWPLAPITLKAEGGEPGDSYWLRADPVHLRLLRDRIVLSDTAACPLSREESDGLARAITQHFGETFSPQALHPGRWYLRLPDVPRLLTTPPSVAIGRDIDPLLPRGEDATRFRSVMNELQMLLHEHSVNQAREARGEPPINSLWLWGGGTLPPAPAVRATVYANGSEAAALAAFTQAEFRPPGARLEALVLASDSVAVLDFLASAVQTGDAYGWRDAMVALETHWFEPMLDVLRRRWRLEMRLFDPISGNALHVRGRDVWRLWQRPEPLEAALA